MKHTIIQFKMAVILFAAFSIFLFSCNKKDILVDAEYPVQLVGISQAAVATVGPGGNGIYTITPKIEGQVFRYIADVTASKFNLPLGVIRSGTDLSGAVTINITPNTDTVTKLITAAKLPAGTELLPSAAYTLPATVNIEDGRSNATFTMPVDLNFLITNIAKKYAVAVGISSPKTEIVNPKLSVVVIYIDPTAVLLPLANFAAPVDNTIKTVSFINLSANGTTYSWNYGDGSPVETTASPIHKYAAAGTYPVTLTTTGITGTPSVKTTNVVIL